MKLGKYRFGTQIFFLILSIYLFVFLILGKYQTAHEFCPYSSVCFGTLSLNPQFGHFIFKYSIIAGLAIAILSIILGRKFCGYVCPIGTAQELLFKFNKKKKQYGFMKYLSWIKYPIFVGTVFLSYNALQYYFITFCPVYSLAHPTMIKAAGIFSLFTIFVVSIFIERFWCRILCPYAAFMNLIQYLGNLLHIPRFNIKRSESQCKSCNICVKNCPMGIDVVKYSVINNPECIHCENCIKACPIDGGLSIKFGKKK